MKSPPELWAELSDVGALARHLGQFGEIRITRVEPETEVAWEGDVAAGTVALEPSGWGTKVTITATRVSPPPPEPEPEPESDPAPVAVEPEAAPAVAESPVAAPRRFAWLRRLFGGDDPSRWQLSDGVTAEPTQAPEPEPAPEPAPEPVAATAPEPDVALAAEEPAADPLDDEAFVGVLTGVLDTLGAAHHRPFSRG